jgi:hypothetical protein
LRLTAGEQRLDQMRCKFLRANAIVFGRGGTRRAALPVELNRNRLYLLGDPRAVNACESQYVVAAGSNGADLVICVREDGCFANRSVKVGDGHNCIVRFGTDAEQSLTH